MLIGPVKLKLQIVCGDEVAMGPGKADLLEAIDREGSISAAGRAMGMSYRRAWVLVDEMSRCWRERLVETSRGGLPNQAAKLTAFGRTVLTTYRALEARCMAPVDQDALTFLEARLRTEPLPAEPENKR